MDEVKSRTQKKNEDRRLQRLGESLAALSPDQLNRIEMPETLREAVRFARGIKSRGARRRQFQYIGVLMREIDSGPVEAGLETLAQGDQRRNFVFKTIQDWRDRLAAGETDLAEEILARCPGIERQRLTQLARNAKKEAEAGKGVKSSRMLFRYLSEHCADI